MREIIMIELQLILSNFMKFIQILKHDKSSILLRKLGKSIPALTTERPFGWFQRRFFPVTVTELGSSFGVTERNADLVLAQATSQAQRRTRGTPSLY